MSTIKVDTIQTRGGVSEIAIDKLKGVSSASSISVVAEGGTNTTNLQQGLAKAFINFRGTSTVLNRDSFNISSLTDTSTGTYELGLSSNMNDTTYTVTGSGGDTNAAGVIICQPRSSLVPATTGCRVTCMQAHATTTDEPYIGALIHGDLA